jgi:DNA-directed RNA polymerase specialized sigma24 family protein
MATNISETDKLVEPAADAPRGLKKNWEITPRAFRLLLARLDSDPQRASEKYITLQHKLIQFFVWRDCPLPEDHADEALNITARRIDNGEEVQDVAAYAYGVARRLCKQYKRAQEVERRALTLVPTSVQPEVGEDYKEQLHRCLDTCLDSLPEEHRKLILSYYQADKGVKISHRRSLASRLGNANALRIKTCRIRAKLEKKMRDCLNRLPVK